MEENEENGMSEILMMIGLILAIGPVLIWVYTLCIPVGITVTRFIDIFIRYYNVRRRVLLVKKGDYYEKI